MMKITAEEVTLGCRAKNRDDVLRQAAFELAARGCVDIGFSKALLDREKELSTWIGSGLAMPHINRRDARRVNRSGFHFLQYPEGVSWDKSHVAFLVVVVAAKDGEHIDMLSSLADLLADERKVARLSLVASKEAFLNILNDQE